MNDQSDHNCGDNHCQAVTNIARFQFLRAVLLTIQVLCNVTMCWDASWIAWPWRWSHYNASECQ